MSVINVRCVDHSLTVENSAIITTGNSKSDSVCFEFCEAWDGWIKTAVFYRTEYNPYRVLLNSNNEAEIPKEVLLNDGCFFFGVFGVKDGAVRTTEVLRYKVDKGVITSEASVPDPTPDIYTQILTRIEEAGILFTRATEAEITSILGDGAEGTNVVTVSRLNQFKRGYDKNVEDEYYKKTETYSKSEIDNKCSLSETGTTYTYTGGN